MHSEHTCDQPRVFMDAVLAHAARSPETTACVYQPRGLETADTLTYRALEQRVMERARLLAAKQFSGKLVALLYPTGLDFVVNFLACLAAGAIAVPMNLSRNANQLQRTLGILEDADIAAILTTQATERMLKELLNEGVSLEGFDWLNEAMSADETVSLPEVLPEQLAFVQYTSGSTSAPKGVMVTHQNIVENQIAIQLACEHTSGLIAGGWLPQFHDMGLIGHMLQPLFLGGTYVFMPPMNFIQRPSRWLQLISHYRIHSSAAPNFGYEHCVKLIKEREDLSDLDLSCWKVALNGSEPVSAETMQKFSMRFEPYGFDAQSFFPCYGMAETTLLVSGGPKSQGVNKVEADRQILEQEQRIVAPIHQPDGNVRIQNVVNCGKVSARLSVAIVSPQSMSRCAEDQIGEIWVHGQSVAQGYLNQPELSKQLFEGQIKGGDSTDYLRTGDMGFIQQGCLFVTGRLKEMLIVRGKNIYPYDLERTCNQYQHVAGHHGVSVFSVEPDQVAAIVEVKKRALKEQCPCEMKQDLNAMVSEQHGIIFDHLKLVPAGTIPKTTSGKIRRNACRQLLNV